MSCPAEAAAPLKVTLLEPCAGQEPLPTIVSSVWHATPDVRSRLVITGGGVSVKVPHNSEQVIAIISERRFSSQRNDNSHGSSQHYWGKAEILAGHTQVKLATNGRSRYSTIANSHCCQSWPTMMRPQRIKGAAN